MAPIFPANQPDAKPTNSVATIQRKKSIFVPFFHTAPPAVFILCRREENYLYEKQGLLQFSRSSPQNIDKQ